MDSGTEEKEGWWIEPLLLLALLLAVVAAVAGLSGAALIAGLISLGTSLVLLLAGSRLHRVWHEERRRLCELERSLVNQRVIDPDTGATLPQWFNQMLDTECRRAVREFMPLTLMQLELTSEAPERLKEARALLVGMLAEQVSRPGDLVGLSEGGALQLLLPCTNEHAESLAQRCIRAAEELVDPKVAVRLAACTLQPKVDLNADKVRQQLTRLVEEVRTQPAGSYRFQAEPSEADLFNPVFTL